MKNFREIMLDVLRTEGRHMTLTQRVLFVLAWFHRPRLLVRLLTNYGAHAPLSYSDAVRIQKEVVLGQKPLTKDTGQKSDYRAGITEDVKSARRKGYMIDIQSE